MIISKSHCGEPIHENRLIRNRVVSVLRRMIRHGTTRSLARGSFESHVVSTFRHHLGVLLHLSENLKLSNTRETTQVYLYQTRESGDHCNKLRTHRRKYSIGKLMLLLIFLE